MPRFDIGNDTLDLGGRKTGVCCNHQVKFSARNILNDIGEFAIGFHNCYMVAIFSKDRFKTSSNYLLLRYDENVVNRSTSSMSEAGPRIGHRLRRPMDELWTLGLHHTLGELKRLQLQLLSPAKPD